MNQPEKHTITLPGIRPRFGRMQNALALGFAGLALFVAAITMLIFSIVIRQQLRAGFQERLQNVAELASQRVDGDLHATLVDPAQEDGLDYNKIKSVLQEIRDISSEFRFVYTMRPVGDDIVFIVDAEPKDSPDISHLGDIYDDVSPMVRAQIANVTGPFVDQEFYTDQWGTFLSGYAPVYTSDGKLDAIVGVDISAQTILARERQALWYSGIVFGIIIPLVTYYGYQIGRRMAEPLLVIGRGAEQLAGGDLSYRIGDLGWQELNRLAQAFNTMADRLAALIANLESTVDERTQEVEKRFEYLRAAAEVGSAVGTILDSNRLINQVVNLIQARFELYYVGLFVLDDTNEWAILRAGTGEAGQQMIARGHRIRTGEGMIGWSIANNKARIALQAEKDEVRLKISELPFTQSEAAIPIRARNRVLGSLSVQSDRPDAFDEAAIIALQTMADQVAVALDNARLFSESQSALEALQRSYQQLTRSAWSSFLHSRGKLGVRVDAQGLSPAADLLGDGDQIIEGISGEGYTLTLPVRIRGQLLGYIQANRPSGGLAWTEADILLVENLVEQLSAALDNARLYSATQRSAERERIMSDITSRVRAASSVDVILQTAVRQLVEALDLPRGMIRLVPGPTDQSDDDSGM